MEKKCAAPSIPALMRGLAVVWADMEAALDRVPLIERLNRGALRRADYLAFLRNHRQQVVEGAGWIARAASNIDPVRGTLRTRFLRHALTEHRDFRMLEDNYVAVGGALDDIRAAPKNIGAEALSAWMYHRASRPDPFDLLGAMFVIEGLGAHKAQAWGEAIRDQLGLGDDAVSFLLHHGAHDGDHMGEFQAALGEAVTDEATAAAVVKTAKVTARLYVLQLEEIDNV